MSQLRLISLAVLMPLAASALAGLGPDSRAKIQHTIKALDAKWSASSKSTNVDQWISYYSRDAVLLAPNEPISDTPAKIRKTMEGFLSLPDLHLSFGSDKVWVAKSLDVAYEYGHYSMQFKDPKGQVVKDHGKYAEVWRKQKSGKWLCVVDMFNSDLPVGP